VFQQPEMEANALVDIISRIQRARKTGLLVVKRMNGSVLEEGTITFVKGQVTGSEAGRRKGQDAFNLLSQWLDCQFLFISPDQDNSFLYDTAKSQAVAPTSPLQKKDPLPSEMRGSPVVAQSNAQNGSSSVPFQAASFEVVSPMIDRLGSRFYRQIFLLIDGKRSIVELVRLTRRDQSEVEKALYDLESLGVIYFLAKH
jgi:hypothetical protein